MDITKTCLSCYGVGSRTIGFTEEDEPITEDCTVCNGTGSVPAYSVNLEDLSDKVDDVMDKCNDIMEAIQALGE